MRKLIVLTFVSLDGVMQAPGGPEEDPAGGFSYGGWSVPYFDDFLGEIMGKQMGHPFDLLLGRKTYEIFAAYWPFQDISIDPAAAAIDRAKKYVATHQPALAEWQNSVIIKDVAQEVKKLKEQEGPEIQVHGSGDLIQTLLKHDLVDELWLKIFPVILGRGKRLFGEGTLPAGFNLCESSISPSGVIVASYVREGEVRTGTFAAETAMEVELAGG